MTPLSARSALALPTSPASDRVEVSFPPDPRRVEHMRRLAAAHLRRKGQADPVIHAVQLLVSEIVTNAITHGGGVDVDFLLTCDPAGEVCIEVDDHSAGIPEIKNPGPDDETGRGMLLVAALAQDWGRTGTRTWCTVSTLGGAA